MEVEALVAAAGLAAVILYTLLGGADFGGGIWDLFAGGPRRQQQRAAIVHAMGPVWEANHVWLILVIVLLFTGFPAAFAELSIKLFVLFHLVLVGITLRGAAFVFRVYSPMTGRGPMAWGAIFGVASVITPVLLGMALAAVSQEWPGGGPPWSSLLSLTVGALALALCAYLAAVYLTNETTGDLQEDFRRRALFAGTFVVGLATALLPVVYLEAPHLWERLMALHSAPVLLIGVLAALLSGWSLLQRRYWVARAAALTQITFLLLGWGIAQYPYLVYPTIDLHTAKTGDATLWFLLAALAAGCAVLVPSLWLLFAVFKGRPLTSPATEASSDYRRASG